MANPPVLVSFEDPPVHETILSVHFEALAGFTSAHAGRLQAEAFREFSALRELPPYAMPIEQNDGVSRSVRMALHAGQPPARTVLGHPSGEELYQVQRDWFAYNWKRSTQANAYPGFPATLEKFADGWKALGDFVAGSPEFDTELVPLQIEVTYINHLLVEGSEVDLNDYFTFIAPIELGSTLGSMDKIGFSLSALFAEPAGSGRLDVGLTPAANEEGQSVFALNLTARGRPAGPGENDLLDFMTACRRAVVESFVPLTTERLHTKWNLQ